LVPADLAVTLFISLKNYRKVVFLVQDLISCGFKRSIELLRQLNLAIFMPRRLLLDNYGLACFFSPLEGHFVTFYLKREVAHAFSNLLIVESYIFT
jgi:hypothetical protein